MASIIKMKRVYYNFNIDDIALQEAEIMVSHYDRIQGGAQMGWLVPGYTIYMGEGLSVLNDSSGCTPIPFFDGLTQSEAISYATYMAVANSEQSSIYNKKYTQLISELRTKINDTSTWAQGEFDEINALIDILSDTILYGIIYDSAVVGQLMSMTSKTGSAVSEYLLPVADFVNNDLSSLLTNLRNSIEDGASTWNSDTYNDPGWAILTSGSVMNNMRALRDSVENVTGIWESNNIDESSYMNIKGDSVGARVRDLRGSIDLTNSHWTGDDTTTVGYTNIKGDSIIPRITDLRDAIAPNGYWEVDDTTTAGYCDFTAYDSCSLIQLYEDHTASEHWDSTCSSGWLSGGEDGTSLFFNVRGATYEIHNYIHGFPIVFGYVEWDSTECVQDGIISITVKHPMFKWVLNNDMIEMVPILITAIPDTYFNIDHSEINEMFFAYPNVPPDNSWLLDSNIFPAGTGAGFTIDIPSNTDSSYYINEDIKKFIHFAARIPPGTVFSTTYSANFATEGSEWRIRKFGVVYDSYNDKTGFFPSSVKNEVEVDGGGFVGIFFDNSSDVLYSRPNLDNTNDAKIYEYKSFDLIINDPITYIYKSITN